MSEVSNAYSRILSRIYNYEVVLSELQDFFSTGYQASNDSLTLSQLNLQDYPKYPFHLKLITSFDGYNTYKLQQSARGSKRRVLIDNISYEQLSRKKVFDKIPALILDLIQDFNYQNTCYYSMLQVYNINNNLLSYKKYLSSPINFYGLAYGDLYRGIEVGEGLTPTLEDGFGLWNYSICNFLTWVILKNSDLYEQLYPELQTQMVNFDVLKSDFNNFVNNNYEEISLNIVNRALVTIYQFFRVSDNLKTDLVSLINNDVKKIKDIFETFSLTHQEEPEFILSKTFSNLFAGLLSSDLMTKIFDDDDIVGQASVDINSFNEDLFIERITDLANSSNIFDYHVLTTFYSSFIFKHLNVFQMVMASYAEEYLWNQTELSLDYFQEKLADLGSAIDFPDLKTFLDNRLLVDSIGPPPTGATYFLALNIEAKIAEFCFKHYALSLIDSFMENVSTQIEEYFEVILEKIYIYLRDNGHVPHEKDWYGYITAFKSNIKAFLRNYIVDDVDPSYIFNNAYSLFNTGVNNILGSLSINCEVDNSIFNSFYASYSANLYSYWQSVWISTLSRRVIESGLNRFRL